MSKPDRPILPLPEPLSGGVFGSFAHHTITVRLPKIARQVIEDNRFPEEITAALQLLIAEIPESPLRELRGLGPDLQCWHKYLEPYRGRNWLEIPWLFAETYFYRRIVEATHYFTPGPFQGYDPYQGQKKLTSNVARPSMISLARLLDKALADKNPSFERQEHDLYHLLISNVWGNQADLSMWSATETRPDHQDITVQRSHLLVDQARTAIEYLQRRKGRARRVDILVDNCNPELLHDLALTDYLLSTHLVQSVRLHAKPYPYFVSDARTVDVINTIQELSTDPEPALTALGYRLAAHIKQKRLSIIDDFFWTAPLSYWEMPAALRQELSESSLVISKGDVNYRRLAGDRAWPPTTPFEAVAGYFPAPLLALRVLKAELALGLTEKQVSQLQATDPGWLVNGNWAVIQFIE